MTSVRIVRPLDGKPSTSESPSPARPLSDPEQASLESSREWLVTNGLGGYCSGTLHGRLTRRFHGLLVAALPPPLGRTLMLSHLDEQIRLPSGTRLRLGAVLLGAEPRPALPLLEVRFEDGLPIWRYSDGTLTVERRVWMPHERNETFIGYRLEGASDAMLELRPWFDIRGHGARLDEPAAAFEQVSCTQTDAALALAVQAATFPALKLSASPGASRFLGNPARLDDVPYAIEQSRGYDARGTLQSPGHFEIAFAQGNPVAVVASVEASSGAPGDAAHSLATEQERRHQLSGRAVAIAPAIARSVLASELVFAADQFLVSPAYRAPVSGPANRRTVIAGYPWFTDWGRDTMISLEGLTLVTGRADEARQILLTFAGAIEDGLIPNMFPEGDQAGLYHTADATLWFFQAIHRYVARTGDRELLKALLPKLASIIDWHVRGTRFGIGVDPGDGLLRQGAPGYQLTWMDAKVGDLVVTPRRGKAVEINALFYNALCLLADWTAEAGDGGAAETLRSRAARCRASFNQKFWRAELGHLLDVVEGEQGDDPALRPNQVLAMALHHPVLQTDHWAQVIEASTKALLTPLGLRSLSPGDPQYERVYFGDLRARDLAYHQGTVWAWLIGPFIDAWLRQYPERKHDARGFLDGFANHVSEACVGTISEIFDAEIPYTSRGCFAQAWSVAEVLRCLVLTEAES